ncbi:discoidin domain-containing protein [Cohnella sp. WQ 127256]|uniref:discoidin domain-containing protein n=1 Tax=Cohnella sp. WQ 127256 TaxID=2938790 RepID=UPI0021189FDE|nr:discoidin domain-containing protein [Cohnella sp. WQ 127256]
MKSIRKILAFGISFCLLASVAIVGVPSVKVHAASTINNDITNKVVTMSGTGYEMKFNYNNKAIITSYKQSNIEMLGVDGIFSAVNNNGTWVTSESLTNPPNVSVSSNVITATFTTPVADETWTFTVNDDSVIYKLSRTYNGSYAVTQQGTPMVHFGQDIVDNIRWNESGGNYPITGPTVSNWLSMGSSNRTSMRLGMEQISYSILNTSNSIALKIDGTSSFSDTERGENTLLQRLPNGQMRFYTVIASGGVAYANGQPKGYFRQDPSFNAIGGTAGHGSTDGTWLYNPVSVTDGINVWSELTFTPDNYDTYYDLGTIEGFSETALSKFINDYGRWIMNDRNHGGYTEGKNTRFESIPAEEHYLTQQVDTFQLNKDKAINAFKAGLTDMRTGQQHADGHLLNGSPGAPGFPNENTWGSNNSDNETGYVLSVINAYYLSGDTAWLNDFKTSVEKALDYELATYSNPTTKLVNVAYSSHAGILHSNEYWEIAYWHGQNDNSAIGQPNGYTSAMLYDALRKWAVLERNVFSDTAKADSYDAIADTLQTSFNLDKADGGAWLPTAKTVILSTTTAETHYLPAMGAALKSNLLSLTRRQEMSKGYLKELKDNNVSALVNNVKDLGNINNLSDYTHLGTDGGMYGSSAGDGYAVFVAARDRDALYEYTNNWLDKPLSNYWCSSWYNRAGIGAQDNSCFPSTAGLAWGLYHYGYGFQPDYDRLTIAPFISNDMVGSKVKYNFRGVDIQVEYLGLNKYTVTIPSMPANTSYIVVKWLNQTPNGSEYNVNLNVVDFAKTADADGSIEMGIGSSGTYTVELTNPDVEITQESLQWSRVDDQDGGISYSGWDIGSDGGYHNGTLHYSNVNGADAQYTFTGIGIRWIGSKNADRGKADIYIDNVYQTTVDTYAATPKYQQVLYENRRLVNGEHTIKVVVTDTKNASSVGYYQDVDAFEYKQAIKVEDVTLDNQTLTFTLGGEPQALSAMVYPTNATDRSVTWSSSNTAVATVDSYGIVTAVAVGTTTITVTTTDGAKLATSTVTVNAPWFRVDDGDSRISYSGWDIATDGGYHNGTLHYSNINGAYAEYTFTGTGIRWIGSKNADRGKADVFIDDVYQTTVDTYSANQQLQQILYENNMLDDDEHTIKIVVTATKNANSLGYYQDLDAFETPQENTGPKILQWSRVDDGDSGINYSGWINTMIDGYYTGTTHYSNANNATAEYSFTGTGIRWIGSQNADHGIAKVYIDDEYRATVDTYATSQQLQQVLYENKRLINGEHTIKIVVTSDKNASSLDYYQDIDAFEVTAPTYAVTFDLNGKPGTAPTDAMLYVAGATVATPTPPTAAGLTFVGWNTSAAATTAGALKMGSGATTFYAIWTAVAATPSVTSVSISPMSASVVQGATQQLTLTVVVVGGAAQTVTWTSNDSNSKVTVNASGLVSVAADAVPGAYTITATSTVDSGKTGTATITVFSAAPSGGENLALNKPAFSSGAEVYYVDAPMANDGNTGTFWSSDYLDNTQNPDQAWWYVDLKSMQSIQSVVIKWRDAYAKKYQILVSIDGTEWSNVKGQNETLLGNKGSDVVNFDPISARFIKFQGVERTTIDGNRFGYAIQEFEVYIEQQNPPVNNNLALNKPAFSSGAEVYYVDAPMANDGNIGTFWSSDYLDNTQNPDQAWWYVDLESVQSIQSIVIKWRDAYAKRYQLLVSKDAVTWTNVNGADVVITGRGAEEMINFSAVEARYVKFQGVERAPVNGNLFGYAIKEFEVYRLPIEKNQVQQIADQITSVPPINAGQSKIILPDVPDGFKIVLYGSDRLPVIDIEGNIHRPLVDAKVNLLFEVVDIVTQKKGVSGNVLVTVPGQYIQSATLNKEPSVIPSLREWYGRTGDFVLTKDSRIVVNPVDKDVLRQIATETKADLRAISPYDLDIVYDVPRTGDLYLSLVDSVAHLGKEGYVLDVSDFVSIHSSDSIGVLYGTRSVLQILKQDGTHKHILPKGISHDYPKYQIRGFMIDVARKFYTIEFLRDYVKQLAWYKMNTFQIHLNDDNWGGDFANGKSSAFRLESEKFPGLASENGSYSKSEFRDLQLLGQAYGVNIIPEIDTPGHSRVFNTYNPNLGSESELDITKQSTVDFVLSLFDEYLDGSNPTFIGPDVHIGTDEYHVKTQADIEIFRAYMNTLIGHINSKGKKSHFWGGLDLYNGQTPVRKDVIMDVWHEPAQDPRSAINQGYDIVNVQDDYLYLIPTARDYLDSGYLYWFWEPTRWISSTLPYGHPKLLGSKFALWNDVSDSKWLSMEDSHVRILPAVQVLSEKMWTGVREDANYDAFKSRAAAIGEAPQTNWSHTVNVGNSDGKVIEYLFDGSLKDTSGEGRDGTGTNVSLVKGKVEQGVRFNGGTSYIETPVEAVGFGWTLSLWIKPDANNPNDAVILESPQGALKLKQGNTGKLGFSKEHYHSVFNYQVPDNKWTHLLITGSSSTTTLYVNGNEFIQTLSGLPFQSFVLPTQTIGSKSNSFIGVLDNVIAWNKSFVPEFQGDLALGKSVSSSGAEVDSASAEKAVDGLDGTFWSSDYFLPNPDSAWLAVDLGKQREINKVMIQWRDAYAEQYQILVSADNVNWINVNGQNAILTSTGGTSTINFETLTARYVKFQGVKRTKVLGNYFGYAITKFEVYNNVSTEDRFVDTMSLLKAP